MAKIFKNVWFKCITVLLSLTVLLGGILALLNDLLYVDDAERTARAIEQIYGVKKDFKPVLETPKVCKDFGTVNKIYLIEGKDDNNFDYLFQVTGENGFQSGDVTYWIKVVSSSGNLTIGDMIIVSNTKQSFISSLNDAWHKKLKVGVNSDSKYLTPWEKVYKKNTEDYTLIPTTGATNSKNASCNAINCVIYYVNNYSLEVA